MGYKVIYFSRTGTSKRVADKIANKLSCEVLQIFDDKDWKGILGYIKAGYYSSNNKEVCIKVNGSVNKNEEIILVAPLWAGGIAPAARAFLKDFDSSKVNLVITSNGSTLKNRSNFKSVSDIVKRQNNEDLVIKTLVDKLI